MQVIVMNPYALAAAGGGGNPGSVDVRTAANNDVAQNNFSDSAGGYGIGWDTMYPMDIATGNYSCAVRWQLNVPQSATIDGVQITFYESEGTGQHDKEDAIEVVGFEQVNNAGQMTSKANYVSRYANLGTTSSLSMFSLPDTTPTNDPIGPFTLPVALIQEIVDRPGWVSGNYVMLFIRDNGSNTYIAQWQAHATRSASYTPRLQVSYTA